MVEADVEEEEEDAGEDAKMVEAASLLSFPPSSLSRGFEETTGSALVTALTVLSLLLPGLLRVFAFGGNGGG